MAKLLENYGILVNLLPKRIAIKILSLFEVEGWTIHLIKCTYHNFVKKNFNSTQKYQKVPRERLNFIILKWSTYIINLKEKLESLSKAESL